MNPVLVLFAHPALEKSRVHRRLVRVAGGVEGVTVHDLYERYPRLDVDVPREQRLLLDHDRIVLQFPFYWYSTPPLLKQWLDLVLEHGWAYGSRGTALRGKTLVCAVSAGGGTAAYSETGHNRHTVRQLMAPLEQTARLCGMRFLPPWVVYGTHRLESSEIDAAAARYGTLLQALSAGALDPADPGLEGRADLNALVESLPAGAASPAGSVGRDAP